MRAKVKGFALYKIGLFPLNTSHPKQTGTSLMKIKYGNSILNLSRQTEDCARKQVHAHVKSHLYRDHPKISQSARFKGDYRHTKF